MPKSVDRELLTLALPTLGTLLAEPLLVATDTALLGHIGATELAGLSLASTILTTLVGLCIFLAYATTAATGRLFGAGRDREGLRQGIDSLYLAAALGLVLGILLFAFANPLLRLFQDDAHVLAHAAHYLHASAFGLPGMLVVLAATGVLRGMADTKTPLYVTTAGALLNIPLDVILIYPAGLSVRGAGIGTAVAQSLMGAALVALLVRKAREADVPLKPEGAGILSALWEGWPLIVRTVSLRLAILAEMAAASALSVNALAANQITMMVWNFAAYGLDSLAIAAQILVGRSLGAGDRTQARAVLTRCQNRALVWGALVGLVLFFASFAIAPLMTSDLTVQHLALASLLIIAFLVPLGSLTYMLDGVLIGAGDTKRLALYMLAALALFAPLALFISFIPSATFGFIILWIAYGGAFMMVRAGTMYLRTRTDEWMGLDA